MSAVHTLVVETPKGDDPPVANWLEGAEGIQLLGATREPADAFRLLGRTRPHVVVLDDALPAPALRSLAERLRVISPATRVVALCNGNPARAEAAQQAMRPAVVTRRIDGPDGVRAAVRLAAASEADHEPPTPRLTPREREVLGLIVEGLSSKQVAALLCISPRTVDNHTQRLMNKLDLHSRVDLVRYAIREGYAAV